MTDHVHQATVELARLGSVDPASLDAPIPHIEGWTVRDVLGHTGWVCRFAAASLASDPSDPPARATVPEPPPGPAVIEWFDEGRQIFLDRLRDTDLEAIRPTWTGPQPAAWWVRRLANEAALHRWDAFAASISPEPIDADLAADAIDEVFEVFVPHRLDLDALDADGATLHLHATDIDHGEWLATVTADGIEWEHGHAKGDVAARGTVSDLALLVWGRIPPSRLEVFGDASLLDRWQLAAAF